MNTEQYITKLCETVKAAAPAVAAAPSAAKNSALTAIAKLLCENSEDILSSNALDVENAAKANLSGVMLDRLKLDRGKIDGIAASLNELALISDPVGAGERWVRPNGLVISRVRVPLGVVAIIYEARPNVTVDAAAICIKTGNGVVLRGGKEAIETNKRFIALIKQGMQSAGLNPDAAALVEDTSREGSVALMTRRGLVDVLIPRGGAGLIQSVVKNATVPVIETGSGNCHAYIDESADIMRSVEVALSAKISRPAVCNAIETLLVHQSAAKEFLPAFAAACEPHGVELRGCEATRMILPSAAPAADSDYAEEFGDLILAVKVVLSIHEAIEHINRYNTGHSDMIMTRSIENAEIFKRDVDSATVYVNASTRFTDGGEFGFGAEIGISTQKLHARGPMGLDAVTTVKYLIDGDYQVR